VRTTAQECDATKLNICYKSPVQNPSASLRLTTNINYKLLAESCGQTKNYKLLMQLNTVIFDMDGLLIDSEPLWNEAAAEVFKMYGVSLSEEQYHSTTGLRTKEFVQWWFRQFNLGDAEHARAEKLIFEKVMMKLETKGKVMPGVQYIFRFFY